MMPEHLPPDVQAAIAAAQDVHQRAHDAEIEQRRTVLHWGAILCGCRPWHDREQPGMPPQAGCVVHGSVMVTLDGEVL